MIRRPVATTMTVIVACLLAAPTVDTTRPPTGHAQAPTSLAASVTDTRGWVDVYDPQTPVYGVPDGQIVGVVTAGVYPTSHREGDWHEIVVPQHGETVTVWVHSNHVT